MLQSGTISERDILNALGQGTGETNVINLTDGNLDVALTSIPGNSEDTASTSNLSLEPAEMDGFPDLSPGRYRMTFTFAVPAGGGGECTLKIDSGDRYEFVAVPEGVAITREKEPAASGPDLNVATSALCRR
jgi:hypothetical protein